MSLKNMAWNVFANTGNIETYLAMKELEISDSIETKANDSKINGDLNGDNKN